MMQAKACDYNKDVSPNVLRVHPFFTMDHGLSTVDYVLFL